MNASADAVPPHANGEGGNPRADGLARAWSILLKIMSIEVAVLVVTGIALFLLYRPPLSHAFADELTHGGGWSVRTSSAVRRIFGGCVGTRHRACGLGATETRGQPRRNGQGWSSSRRWTPICAVNQYLGS